MPRFRSRWTSAGAVALAALLATTTHDARADWAAGQRAYEGGDYGGAAAEWRPVAERGEARAQSALGSLYIHGRGVDLDYAEGLRWTELAAAQDEITAQFNMGTIYAGGLGVLQDYEIAARWFRKAAARDDAASRYNLGIMYARGLGVVRDDIEAVFWLNTAAVVAGAPESGLQQLAHDAERFATVVMLSMPRPEIDEALKRSRAWQAEYLTRYMRQRFSSE